MNIPGLHIDFEELVFHGFSPEQAHAVAAHLQREMEQLAQHHFEANPGWAQGELPLTLDLPALTMPPMALNTQAPALETARHLAKALWTAISPSLAPAAPAAPVARSQEALATRLGYRNLHVTNAKPTNEAVGAPSLAPRPAFFGAKVGAQATGSEAKSAPSSIANGGLA